MYFKIIPPKDTYVTEVGRTTAFRRCQVNDDEWLYEAVRERALSGWPADMGPLAACPLLAMALKKQPVDIRGPTAHLGSMATRQLLVAQDALANAA